MTLTQWIQSKSQSELIRWYQALKKIKQPNPKQQQILTEIEDYLWEEYRL